MEKLGLSWIVGVLLIFSSCGENEKIDAKNQDQENAKNETTNSCLDFAITEKYLTLDPIKITDVTSFHILSQIYEPLLRFNEKDLNLEPLLAESWSVSDDNLVYTFNLKKGVYFQENSCFKDSKGKEFNASDVVYTFERIFSSTPGNYAYSLFRNTIKGSEKYKTSGGSISGIRVIDEHTISFTLVEPSSSFISLMATTCSGIVTKTAIEKNAITGTGPFTYSKKHDTELVVKLLKNQNYHMADRKGNSLPYLEAVAFNYIKDGQDELTLFKEGKLDVIVGISPEAVKEIVEAQISDFKNNPTKYVLGRYPKILTSFIALNTAIKPFNNIKIRQAISMAINKTKIVDHVLKGEAFGVGDHGIVPPAIKGYDFSSVIGHEYNIVKAKNLLAKAGYPNGEGFPIIKFAVGKGNTSVRVALEIQKQLLINLNVNVEISSLTKKEIMTLSDSSQTDMLLSGWLAEFPDPVSFLSLCYGADVPQIINESAFPNESRYRNSKFDRLYQQAAITLDEKKRYELCLEADQIIATEVPVIPLWYHENYQLIHSSIKNYKSNPMNLQYLTYVKIESLKSNKKEE
tara:strand:+ start:4122 stop:5843 length:1722 start_codon:yes stop_codon:yes gene_type:complete